MEEPIRVLHILQRMEAGGVQTFLMNIYRKIDRTKVQFDFLVHYEEKEFYDNEIYEMGGRIYKFSVRENFDILKYKREIKKFFKEHTEYSIVHGHMETLSNVWEKEAKKAGIPNIICHAHTAGYNERNIIKLLIKHYFKYSYGRNSTIRFACSDIAGKFMFSGLDYRLINNAIDIEKFKFSQEQRNKIRTNLKIDNCLVIGNVGRLHPSKNQLFLIEIAKELNDMSIDAKTLLIGDGELKKAIKEKISEYGLENHVILLGKRSDVNLFYSAMDFFVMPSLYEGLPLTGVEAQTSGVQCLFSSEITKELELSDIAHFLPLSETAFFWANKIKNLSKIKYADRSAYADIISKRGYNIHLLVQEMTELYLSLNKRGD